MPARRATWRGRSLGAPHAHRLHVASAHDLSVEVGGLNARRDAQLAVQYLDAGLVLPLSELRLPQAPIAAHQQAMRAFVAGVHGEDLRAHRCAGGPVLAVEVHPAQAVEGVKISITELLAQREQPLVVAVLREELALVEGDACRVLAHRSVGMPAAVQLAR